MKPKKQSKKSSTTKKKAKKKTTNKKKNQKSLHGKGSTKKIKASAKKKVSAKKIDVRAKVKSVISRVTKISESEIAEEKLIRDDLGVDSMQAIETLAILEKELDIVLDPETAFNVATVGDLFKLIQGHVRPAAAKRGKPKSRKSVPAKRK